jgi:hypothetical protein
MKSKISKKETFFNFSICWVSEESLKSLRILSPETEVCKGKSVSEIFAGIDKGRLAPHSIKRRLRGDRGSKISSNDAPVTRGPFEAMR